MERRDVWFVAIVCAVLGLIVGMAWVDFWNELNPVKEYQTLIAGLAAVAAAFATINTMHRTDEGQAERHRQKLVDITLRADRLKASRAAFGFPKVIRTMSGEVDFLIMLTTKISDITPDLVDRLRETTQSIEKRVRRLLKMENLRSAQDIFDETTSGAYHSVLMMMEGDGLSTNLGLINYGNSAHARVTMRAFVSEVQRFQSGLNDLAEGLERLRDDLDPHRPPSSS
ncbi:hypothetical protein EN829_014965 [Mesorhizobium sp. M00.F.Ca.ET.186.01.1.1]|nr:hypothetical protein EN848_14470 [bacterium M00.F.Ca.ET.205.01.1.1]TGU52984.1 hypothetical protein EN795_14925 [bacterium M00.F.Ca.ET.152.01.1.1]TGV35953.1 hypothetical protein EN829_014965 [Mesorhizobium sp. M00.F.Ca.ET.186.01.1.1]TGZ43536.1 hypothetical protein EN805_10535 [bacterium M00.F.Ca.ET.162.01.1.1]